MLILFKLITICLEKNSNNLGCKSFINELNSKASTQDQLSKLIEKQTVSLTANQLSMN